MRLRQHGVVARHAGASLTCTLARTSLQARAEVADPDGALRHAVHGTSVYILQNDYSISSHAMLLQAKALHTIVVLDSAASTCVWRE